MPSNLTIYPQHNLALVTHSGILTVEDVSGMFRSFEAHPDARPGLLILVDFTTLDHFDGDVMDFLKLQMFASEIFASALQEQIMCFYCPPGPNSRLARSIASAWEAVPGVEPRLAETEAQAISILGLGVDRLSQITPAPADVVPPRSR